MVLFSAFYSTSQPAEAESTVLLITISAAIYLMILIIEIEDMRQLLLGRGNAAGVPAADHIGDAFHIADNPAVVDEKVSSKEQTGQKISPEPSGVNAENGKQQNRKGGEQNG